MDGKLRFPSGRTVEQVKKDAAGLQKADARLSWHQALDKAAIEKHQSPDGFDAGRKLAEDFAAHEGRFEDTPDRRFCAKCERYATVRTLLGVLYCGFHWLARLDVDDETVVPPFKGVIPDGARCFGDGATCMDPPSRILGGACWCEAHYEDAHSGRRQARRLSF